MFSPAPNTPMLANSGLSNPGDLDGTINPASLGSTGAYTSHITTGQHHLPFTPPATATSEYDSKPRTTLDTVSPRGLKRSRSPEHRGGGGGEISASTGPVDDPPKRKRGRPPKPKNVVTPSPQLPTATLHQPQPQQQQQQQPQQQPQHVPQHHTQLPLQQQQPQLPQQQLSQASIIIPASPQQQQQQPLPQATISTQQIPKTPATTLPTPPKPTPSKPTTIKALPTVRDHTTDQLTPEGDEYIPRETDENGDKKLLPTGYLLGGREYRCRTFHVPNRGDKLFMLATECARVLGYRDSYLLFNKNRSLYKIIATQAEKDDLIQQELLPYSYRSRQIAIVTARSMFRQFGSRVIVNGRRVRDDYWEMKARKQGFTEDDPAGEKRPGAAKQRAAAASEQAAQQAIQANQQQSQQTPTAQGGTNAEANLYTHDAVQLDQQPQGQMVQPGPGGPSPASLQPLPMIHVMPQEERTSKELYSVPRPRHEITNPPYQDRSSNIPMAQIMDQAQQTADYNKVLTQTRAIRTKRYSDMFKKSPPPGPQQQQQQQQATVTSPPLATHHTSQQQQHAPPQPAHPQMHPPPPMMSPQQLSSLNHQHAQQQHAAAQQQHAAAAAQQHAQQQQQPQSQQLHPMNTMMQHSPRTTQGIKPEQLHSPAAGGYLPQGPFFHPQSQPQPGHTQPQPTHPQQRQLSQSHTQAMPSLQHVQYPGHPQQAQMYPPSIPQQFLQHQQQYPPSQGYRPSQQQQHPW